MADEKQDKELKDEEMEAAAGGRSLARTTRKPGEGGRVVADARPEEDPDGGGSTPSIGDVTPLDDPAFQ